MDVIKSLASNTFFNIIYRMASLLFPLIISAYISRILYEEGIGRVAYAQNVVSYFVAFSSSGMADYGVREISKVRDEKDKMNQVFTQLFVINLALTVATGICYLFFIWAAKPYLEDVKLLLICGLSIVFNTINVEWFYRGTEEYSYIAIRSVLVKILLSAAVIVCVRNTSGYAIYAFLLCIATGGNYVFNIFHLKNRVSLDFSHFRVEQHIAPLTIITSCAVLGSIYNKADITMLGIMDSDAAVGIYFNAHRLIDVVITLCISITGVFLPRLSYYYQNNKQQFMKVLEIGVQLLSFISIPACIAVILLSEDLVGILFGSAFIPAARVVEIFAVLIVVKSFGDLLCYQLVLCTGNEKKRIPAYLFAAVINVVLNCWWIPDYSYVGAAMASVISEMIVNGYQLVKMKKIISFHIDMLAIAQAFAASAVMCVFLLLWKQLQSPSIFRLIGSVIIGLAIYLLMNVLMKNTLLQYALNTFKRMLNPKNSRE